MSGGLRFSRTTRPKPTDRVCAPGSPNQVSCRSMGRDPVQAFVAWAPGPFACSEYTVISRARFMISIAVPRPTAHAPREWVKHIDPPITSALAYSYSTIFIFIMHTSQYHTSLADKGSFLSFKESKHIIRNKYKPTHNWK